MNPPIKNILITGPPGCGKTTLFRRLVKELRLLEPVGFYTLEIRERGVRKGFTLTSLEGTNGLLAHVDLPGGFRVGRYGVDVAGFESFIKSIPFSDSAGRLVMIDEIGKMECFSKKFTSLISRLLESKRLLIATVAMRGGGLIAEIKKRDDIQLVQVNRKNQDKILEQVLKLLK